MTKFVRVKLENGALASVSAVVAEAAELKPLDPEEHPAVDRKGRPLPVEYPDAAADVVVGDASVDQLRSEIDARNEGRNDGDKLSKGGSKDELAARLVADDQANPAGS
jgi:hypothetical protein